MAAVEQLSPHIGVVRACVALGVNRARVYRVRMRRCELAGAQVRRQPRPRPPLALSRAEREALLHTLNSERFADLAPASIYATLLDEGHYLGSVRTMYRLLAESAAVRERRNQLRPTRFTPSPSCSPPRPAKCGVGTSPKLKGPAKWTCFHLYVILDIFSRYVVGWMIALREAAELAEQLIADTVAKHNIAPATLTLHADRGTSMRSESVAQLLVNLEIAKTHSRPHVSDDNPYSEAVRFPSESCIEQDVPPLAESSPSGFRRSATRRRHSPRHIAMVPCCGYRGWRNVLYR